MKCSVSEIILAGQVLNALMSQNFSGVERIISDPVIAEYSTEEKAIKAMEMCREKYLSRMELDGGHDVVNGCYVQPNYWVLPKV